MSVQKASICVPNECSMCGVGVPNIVHVYCECVFTVLVNWVSCVLQLPPPRPQEAEERLLKTIKKHLKFSDTVNNCFTFVYMLLLDCRGCLVRAAKAVLAYGDANVVAVFYINVTLIVMSDTSVLLKQFFCMPKNLLHSVCTFANTNIFI